MADEKKETQAEAPATETKAAAPRRRKDKRNVPVGVMHISASFNNTIITIADPSGNTISWASAGSCGFKGSRKSTPFAAQVAAEQAVKKAQTSGLRQLDVLIDGPGAGREAALRAIQGTGVRVSTIRDVTPIPHNGCRPPKKRRV